MNLSQLSVTEIAIGAGAFVALVAYAILILVPAWGCYGRWWERFAASFEFIPLERACGSNNADGISRTQSTGLDARGWN